MVSEICNAKDRATCKYHGALDHARLDLVTAKENYIIAVQAFNAAYDEPSSGLGFSNIPTLQGEIYEARAAVEDAQATLDAIPAQLKELREQYIEAKENGSDNAKALKTRIQNAEKKNQEAAAERKKQGISKKQATKLTAAQREKATLFEQISNEVAAEPDPGDGWKVGYKRAISGVVAREGQIVSGSGYSSYGIYRPAVDEAKDAHWRSCEPLDIRNVREHAWEEWNFDSRSSVQTSREEYKVTGEATCKCGELVCEQIEVSGSFSDITRQVLEF